MRATASQRGTTASQWTRRFRVFLAVLSLGLAAGPAAALDGAAIVYGLHTPAEDAFRRLLAEKSVRYVCAQQIVTRAGVPPLARARARALAKAGKRVVLQIWWGPGGDFPWSKYSFANVALDGKVRADFFREVVDPCIDQYGAGNLYGVHLLEESGMQFATDLAGRKDPDDFTMFEEPGSSYSTPFWSGAGAGPGGLKMANVRRHEKDFTRMTGFRFADADRWGVLEHHLFARWTATRLQSGGQVEFAKHVHRKYPKLKAFTWDILLAGGENPRTDYHLLARHFDGVISDVYSGPNFNFNYQRAYRLLCPKAELIHFAMGGMGKEQGYPYATADGKRALTLGAYLAGADVVGFFEHPPDFARPDAWKDNTDIFRRLRPVPAFRKKPALLLLANSVSNIYSSTNAWTGLKYYDFLPTWEAHRVDLDPYQAVILHVDGPITDSTVFWNAHALRERYGLPGHVDYRSLDRFVARGGVLFLSGQVRLDADCPLFVARQGYLRTAGGAGSGPPAPLAVSPAGWLKEAAGLGRAYRFRAHRMPMTADPKRVVTTEAGYFLRHGKGAVFVLPFNRFYDPQEAQDSAEWQDYRRLLTDVARGVLKHLGKAPVAAEYLADPARGNAYLEAAAGDRRRTGYVVFDPGQMARPQWRVPGTDLLTGRSPVVLGAQSSAALVERQAGAHPKRTVRPGAVPGGDPGVRKLARPRVRGIESGKGTKHGLGGRPSGSSRPRRRDRPLAASLQARYRSGRGRGPSPAGAVAYRVRRRRVVPRAG